MSLLSYSSTKYVGMDPYHHDGLTFLSLYDMIINLVKPENYLCAWKLYNNKDGWNGFFNLIVEKIDKLSLENINLLKSKTFHFLHGTHKPVSVTYFDLLLLIWCTPNHHHDFYDDDDYDLLLSTKELDIIQFLLNDTIKIKTNRFKTRRFKMKYHMEEIID